MLGSYNTSELSCQAKNWRKVERIKMNFPLIQWWFFHPHMYFREVMWPLASRGQCSSLNDVRLASPALRARKHPCPRIPRPPEQTFEVLPKHIFPEYKSYGLVSLDSFWVLPLKQKHFHKMESQSLYGNINPLLLKKKNANHHLSLQRTVIFLLMESWTVVRIIKTWQRHEVSKCWWGRGTVRTLEARCPQTWDCSIYKAQHSEGQYSKCYMLVTLQVSMLVTLNTFKPLFSFILVSYSKDSKWEKKIHQE